MVRAGSKPSENARKKLRARLAEAEETLAAIRCGDVDAIAVDGPHGRQIFTLQSDDQPYRILAEQMSEGAASIAADGTILFCNERLAAIVARPAAKVTGTLVFDLVVQNERERFRQAFAPDSPPESRIEASFQRLDGRSIPVLASIKRFPNGSTTGFCLVATDLSEFKRAEAEKAEAQEVARRLVSIITHSNDAIIGKDLQGVVTSWNHGAEAVYGYTAEEMIGHPATAIVPPERLEEFQAIMRKAGAGQQVRYDTERRRKDGTMIPVSLSVSPVLDGSGNVVGVSTVARDVTERLRAETELRRAALYTRSLIEASLDPLVTISKDGKITDVNEATERATGLPRERLIGSDFSDYFTDPQRAREGYQRVFGEGFVRDYALAIRSTSRAVMHVLYNAAVFKGANGEVEGVFAAARDITERKQAEEALNRSESRYRSLVTATAQIVWTTNRDGAVVDDMPMWRAYTGLSREEIAGAGWLDSLHPDDRGPTEQVWAKAWRNRDRYDTEYRIRRQDGEYRTFAVRGVPVLEDDGTVREWVGTCTDITERKQAEEQVRLLNESLEQRVKERTAQLEAANTELEAFTYSVSHDLRAPLRHISGFSKILSEEFGPVLPPDAQRHIRRIEEGTVRMGQLVDDLLNLARVGRRELSLQAVSLKSLVEEVIATLRADLGDRNVEFQVGDLPYADCDAGLIKQVFQNLLSNAVKFSRPRQRAVIEVGREDRDGITIVYVRDNGVGFSMKYSDKLFGVFQRLHRVEDFEGTGVGLATVQRIIQKHGGRIWAEAELDKGATFYFSVGKPEHGEVKTKATMAGE